MIRLTEQEINAIAEKIAGNLGPRPAATAMPRPDTARDGIYATVDEAVRAAKLAQVAWVNLPLATRRDIIRAVRDACLANETVLAKAAHSETGLGRWQDKVIKNHLVTTKTPGIEDLQPAAYTGDFGFTLVEPAPFGVIGSITPTTNPTSTIICNSIGMIAAGNSVTFNVHPNAKNCCAQTIALINKTITANGGPANLITGIADPTIESAQALMSHPLVNLVVVTGGPGVVKAAQASGKRAICAGPGNPPVVVDETADIEKAGRDIVTAASFDNNVICTEEKETVVVASVADQLLQVMGRHGAVVLSREQAARMEQVIFLETRGPRRSGKVNPKFIGKNANLILREIGIDAPDTVRLAVMEVDEDHPLLWTEQLMPVMPVTRVPNADYAIDLAIQMEGRRRHTAVMHSKHIDRLSRMARECDCSIFVKNGQSHAGLGLDGEGYCSFTISSPTGEGLTGPRSFSRWRRCTMVDAFRIT